MAKDLQVSHSLEAREHWIEDELAGCEFADARHGKRLGKLLEKISFGQGSSMPWAFQDWANTKPGAPLPLDDPPTPQWYDLPAHGEIGQISSENMAQYMSQNMSISPINLFPAVGPLERSETVDW